MSVLQYVQALGSFIVHRFEWKYIRISCMRLMSGWTAVNYYDSLIIILNFTT